MPLKGSNKTEYQRDYMRKKRDKQKALQGGVECNARDVTPDRRTRVLAEALIDPIKRGKLIRISDALNKEVTAPDGRRVNLGTMVRYGIEGFTFSEIAELL